MKLSLKKAIPVLLFIILLGAVLRLYKLGNQSFIADEYIGVNIAYGYQQTGQWKFWDFNNETLTDESYTRANVYYWQVARILDFLQLNEFNTRLISAIWGISGIILVFGISYLLFRNPTLSLIAALMLAVSISALMYDRKLRMYAMFAPVYLALSYSLYQLIESECRSRIVWIQGLSKYSGLNLNYLFAVILFGVISLQTHLLTINILPMAAVYSVAMAAFLYKNKEGWKNKYTLFSAVSLLSLLIFMQMPEEFKGAINLSAFNWSYLEKITLDYSHQILAFSFMLLGAVYLIKKDLKKGLWISLSFVVPLLMAIFVWHRNAGHQYIYFILPFKVFLMAGGIFWAAKTVVEKMSFRRLKPAFWATTVFIIFILINIDFFSSDESFYKDPVKWSYPNYKQAYGYYIKHRLPDDLLITRKLTYYYIRGSHSHTLNYNSDDKLSLDDIKQAQSMYDRIWFVASGENYLKGGTMDYIERNFKLIETKYTKKQQQYMVVGKGALISKSG